MIVTEPKKIVLDLTTERGIEMEKKEVKKIALAYSGGLDTSIIIPWLKENYNDPEIIAVCGNVGQQDELEGLEEKALKTGASKLIVADLVDEMVEEVIIPSLKMDATYEGYLLGTAFARPIIGKKLAQVRKNVHLNVRVFGTETRFEQIQDVFTCRIGNGSLEAVG